MNSPFLVKITDNRMVISRLTEAMPKVMYSIALTPKFDHLSFLLKDNQILCENPDYLSRSHFTIETKSVEEAEILLNQLTTEWLRYEKKKRLKKTFFWVLPLIGIAAAFIVTASRHFILPDKQVAINTHNGVMKNPSQEQHTRSKKIMMAGNPFDAPTVSSDGWRLGDAERVSFVKKLRNAAENTLFSISYSQGHKRTLYVFADPHCPNCQRLEPALNLASKNYNVIVFPVAIIGKEKSLEDIASVLCLLPEKRKAAWDKLYDVGSDVLDFGTPDKIREIHDKIPICDLDKTVAKQAIAVNEVAWKAHDIPGTPWVISDEGRYVSQSTLKDPRLLSQFLNTSEGKK